MLENAEDLLASAYLYRDVDLILLDINLPGMDGLTALVYMKQLSMISHIPVIMISGDSDMQFVKRAATLNVLDYIIKPYIPSKLLARIEQIVNLPKVSGEKEKNDITNTEGGEDTQEES